MSPPCLPCLPSPCLLSDALSDMLTDGSIVNFIAEVKAKDQSLRKRILEAIKNLLKKWSLVVDSYKGKDLDTAEAQALSQFEDTFKKLQEMYQDAFMDANEVAKAQKNTAKEGDVKMSERDYPIDPDVDNTVKTAYTKPNGKMHELSEITSDQNKAINRLVNQSGDNSFQGKYTGGKHRFSDTAVRHIIAEHGDFLREGLRAQLPMTLTDVSRHLSAIKDNKNPSSIKASRTKRGLPSILTSYEVNGYTLYAEEITKSLGKNLPSDLIGHTMYKAPTLATAAALATSARALPKRQSEVLCEYYMPNGTVLSTENFVADKNGDPALLNFISKNSSPKADVLLGGLIALSSDSTNFTDKLGQVDQGYVRCKKPFYITQDNRVFSNSETNVAQKIEELKKQGYDCFIFDKTVGDNYMVAVVNKAQIIKNKPTRIFSDRDSDSVSTRSLLANALEGAALEPEEKNLLRKYKTNIRLMEAEQKKLSEIQKQLFTKGAVNPEDRKTLQFEAKLISTRINDYDRKLLNLEATKTLKNVLEREKTRARKKQKEIDNKILQGQKDKAAAKQRELMNRYQESRKKAVEKTRETRDKRDAMTKLQKLVLDTSKWISYPSKTDVKCPDFLRAPYANFLQGIDLSSKRKLKGGDPTQNDLRVGSAMDELAKAIRRKLDSQNPENKEAEVLDAGYLDLPNGFVTQLETLSSNIKNLMSGNEHIVQHMTSEEVNQLARLIETLNHSIKNMRHRQPN